MACIPRTAARLRSSLVLLTSDTAQEVWLLWYNASFLNQGIFHEKVGKRKFRGHTLILKFAQPVQGTKRAAQIHAKTPHRRVTYGFSNTVDFFRLHHMRITVFRAFEKTLN